MHVLSTIAPIFGVIALGFMAQMRGFISREFIGPANRIVFYLALPALVFRAVSQASLKDDFNSTVLIITLLSAVIIYFCGWLITKCTKWGAGKSGSFIQCVGHGNHAYVGLPIAFYFLAESDFTKVAILAGFLFIVQHILSVLALQTKSGGQNTLGNQVLKVIKKLLSNPIILSAFAGMTISLYGITIPDPILHFLDIMSGMAAPMSLILIGASLSFKSLWDARYSVFSAVAIKLIFLPVCGVTLFVLMDVHVKDYLPALILLATPTASITYVMAGEMGGDCEFTAAAVSASTMCSALTYVMWLTIVS